MSNKRVEISQEEIKAQLNVCERIASQNGGKERLAQVLTFGCQQNEADSEKIKGYLSSMGYSLTDDEFEADVIVINTCAVREHAEMRVLGNIGALTHSKKLKPSQIICVCGCMVQQEHIVKKIKKSYKQVDLTFGPDEIWRFPSLLETVMIDKARVFALSGAGTIAEGIPHSRREGVKAWLSIMYGCDNFCTYCVVPYTRQRERSRKAKDVIFEAMELAADGYKDITLLGQNVNSYGNDLDEGLNFPQLMRRINDIEGDFVIRFMTSHPKDASEELFKAMADCEKCERHLHLPLQSGSDRILKLMNRGYTAKEFLKKVEAVRLYIPDLVLTSDVIVGFPGETAEDFEETMRVIESVRFDAMFTFIYSKRQGTPAAKMDDPVTREEKQVRFDRLLRVQNRISEEKHMERVGKTERVLIDGKDKDGFLTARTSGGRLLRLLGEDSLIGSFVKVLIVDCNTWSFKGEIIN